MRFSETSATGSATGPGPTGAIGSMGRRALPIDSQAPQSDSDPRGWGQHATRTTHRARVRA
jgi:hypothetical protein